MSKLNLYTLIKRALDIEGKIGVFPNPYNCNIKLKNYETIFNIVNFNIKVRDFLPVKNAYGEVGLLDRVSGRILFYQLFTEGPEIKIKIKRAKKNSLLSF